MNLIENSVTFYSDGSSSKTLEPDKITFTLPNSTSYQKFITNDTLNFGFKYKTKSDLTEINHKHMKQQYITHQIHHNT